MSQSNVVIQPEAELDLEDAKSWYDRQRLGLGDEFLLSFEEAIDRIRRDPTVHAPIYKDLRRTFMRRFPYGVFYLVEDDRVIVVDVLHGRRSPRTWQSRV